MIPFLLELIEHARHGRRFHAYLPCRLIDRQALIPEVLKAIALLIAHGPIPFLSMGASALPN